MLSGIVSCRLVVEPGMRPVNERGGRGVGRPVVERGQEEL